MIVGFPLEPVGARIDARQADGTGVILVGRDLDADAQVLLRRQQMVDDIETSGR